MQRLLARGLVLLMLVLLPSGPAMAHHTRLDVVVNGHYVGLSGGLLERGTTWVPLWEFCLYAGCNVTYDAAAKKVDAYVYAPWVHRHERVLTVDLRKGIGWTLEAGDPSLKFPVRVHHGRLLVPVRHLVLSALDGRVILQPQGPVLALSPWPIWKHVAALRVKLERIGRTSGDRYAADEHAINLIDGTNWQWLLYLDHGEWAPPKPPAVFDEYQFLFWGDDRRQFLARIVDAPFSLDQPPYAERTPSVDLLIWVDTTAPPREHIQWVAYVRPDAEGQPFPELEPYLKKRLGIVREFGTRPEISGELRLWFPGPGHWNLARLGEVK